MNYKHGYAGTKTYNIWSSMKARCLDINNKHYKDYGGRGISYCASWNDFRNFLNDLGECPEGFSLERKDVNGNYNKENCCYIPMNHQSFNRRDTVRVVFDNKEITLRQFCKDRNIPFHRIYARICKLGWSIEDALTRERWS